MKYLLSTLFVLVFLSMPSDIWAQETQSGAQLYSATIIPRLIPSQYGFQWLKYQYRLGSELDPLIQFITDAKAASRGKAGIGYKVLVSIAKNTAGIETLVNPPYTTPAREKCPPEGQTGEWSQQYCPSDDELAAATTRCEKNCSLVPDPNGIPNADGTIPTIQHCEYYTVTETPYPNGYYKFMNFLKELAPYLSQVDAVEIWNEPNLADEWTNQGLGPLSPENYVNFLNCGIKGLKAGGYTGKIISAAPAPNAPNSSTSLKTEDFFDAFILAGGLKNVDYIGWHSNVTEDIPPEDNNPRGFQSVKYTLNKGKPVWVTEFGWQWNKLKPSQDYGGNEEYNQRQQQALYIADAYKVADSLGNIFAMAVFNFGFFKETGTFKFEDIEGTVAMGTLCQPNAQVPMTDRGDTNYIQDVTLRDDAILSSILARGMIPEIVNQDIALKTGAEKETNVEVIRNFFDTIKDILYKIMCFVSNIPFLSFLDDQCKDKEPFPNISLGLKEEEIEKVAPGQNTATLSATAKILGAIAAPEKMARLGELRDCNLGDVTNLSNPKSGESRLLETSAGFGTAAGFYGVDIPDFKTISPQAWEPAMSARMIDQNLNIGNKLFSADRRSPDICLRQKDMIRGFFPEAVFPANITCDQISNILDQINKSQFSNRI